MIPQIPHSIKTIKKDYTKNSYLESLEMGKIENFGSSYELFGINKVLDSRTHNIYWRIDAGYCWNCNFEQRSHSPS